MEDEEERAGNERLKARGRKGRQEDKHDKRRKEKIERERKGHQQ